jgi:hypothetical protein
MKRGIILICAFLFYSMASILLHRVYGKYFKKLQYKYRSKIISTDESLDFPKTFRRSTNFNLHSKNLSKVVMLQRHESFNVDISNQTFENTSIQNSHYRPVSTETGIKFCEYFEVIERANLEKELGILSTLDNIKKEQAKIEFSTSIIICDVKNVSDLAHLSAYSLNSGAISNCVAKFYAEHLLKILGYVHY